MEKRTPTKNEYSMIRFLLDKSNFNYDESILSSLKVESMNDSGMGSLLIFTKDSSNSNRVFGKTISEFKFKDEDGVEVNIGLNVDTMNDLFELDVWKVDFSPLIAMPNMDNELI